MYQVKELTNYFTMYGKMQESGLTENQPFNMHQQLSEVNILCFHILSILRAHFRECL